MNAKNWRPIRKISRRFGLVQVVLRSKNGRLQKGYFKYPCRKNKRWGNIIANELIAYHLAKLLKLNVAHVELAVIGKKQGIVSVVKPTAAHFNWFQLARKVSGSPIRYLLNPEQLLSTFVFDTWICNIDRHGGNLIAFPRGKRYDFYLIDHGSALTGAITWRRVPWNSDYWLNLNHYNYHYPRGLRPYIRSLSQLLPHVTQIENIPESTIRSIVESVPDNILPKREKTVLVEMLLFRQGHLRSIVTNWCIQQRKVAVEIGHQGVIKDSFTSNKLFEEND